MALITVEGVTGRVFVSDRLIVTLGRVSTKMQGLWITTTSPAGRRRSWCWCFRFGVCRSPQQIAESYIKAGWVEMDRRFIAPPGM